MSVVLNQFMERIQKIMGNPVYEGGFIYRGESERYPEVSSNLWRTYKGCHYHDDFDIESLQKERVNAAKEHIPTLTNNRVTVAQLAIEEQRDFEILTDIQHYGGETNLIDFTRD